MNLLKVISYKLIKCATAMNSAVGFECNLTALRAVCVQASLHTHASKQSCLYAVCDALPRVVCLPLVNSLGYADAAGLTKLCAYKAVGLLCSACCCRS